MIDSKKVIVVTHGKFMNAVISVLSGKEELGKTRYFKNTEILKINLTN
jgi:broad specificity phosphatase PhoE